MTSYPINGEWDKHYGVFCDGYAETEAEALAVMAEICAESESEAPKSARIAEFQLGGPHRTREIAESLWAAEIEDGTVSVSQVYGGWIASMETWRAD